MWVRVLGSAAGGGFPQWNCACPACRAVRDGSRPARPRTQSSIAVSPGDGRWFIFNASPDIRSQIESFPPLHPAAGPGGGRTVPLQAVLLTDAELDHTLGLLLLREGRGVELHATEAVRDTLDEGTSLLRTLEAYCQVQWRPVMPGADVALADGLSYRAFDVPTTKRARFGPDTRKGRTGKGTGSGTGSGTGKGTGSGTGKGTGSGTGKGTGSGTGKGRVVGYRLTDGRSGQTLVYLPSVQDLAAVRDQLDDCACLLVDGTCWHDDELIRLGLAGKTARDMGHQPIDGPGGSLAQLAQLPIERMIYTHINNTNPILLEDAPERLILKQHGMEVAMDGLELRM